MMIVKKIFYKELLDEAMKTSVQPLECEGIKYYTIELLELAFKEIELHKKSEEEKALLEQELGVKEEKKNDNKVIGGRL